MSTYDLILTDVQMPRLDGFSLTRRIKQSAELSRVPVVMEQSRLRAILEGDNSDTLRLAFIAGAEAVQVGDRVVTSGHGGMFPAGLPVGAVSEIDGDVVRVAPLVAFGTLEFVRVLRFDFPTLDPAPGDPELGGRE